MSKVFGSRSSKDDHGLGNINEAIFQVCAPNKFAAVSRYKSALDQLKTELTPSSDMYEAIDKLKRIAVAEAKENRDLQRRRLGDPVVYGQTVQFWHPYSQKYVVVDHTSTSLLESANLRVRLSSTSSKAAWFRIRPNFKIHSEGDLVKEQDFIRIESCKILGQYIHTSVSSFRDGINVTNQLEVNVSVVSSSYSIQHYRVFDVRCGEPATIGIARTEIDPLTFPPLPEQDEYESHLCGGDVFRLRQSELDAYLAAEGVFVESEPIEGLHLRVRLPDDERPRRLYPPSTAVTFWQVEINKSPMSGAAVKWGEIIRLRHVPTQRYLSMTTTSPAVGRGETFKLGLVLSANSPNTAFCLEPVSQDASGTIENMMYLRVVHIVTGGCVFANDHLTYDRGSQAHQELAARPESLEARMDGIAWDGAPLRQAQIVLNQTKHACSYRLELVDSMQTHNTEFMCGLIRVFHKYTTTRINRELTILEALQLVETLKEAEQFVYVNGSAQRKRQKLFRNLRVVDMLIKMLQVPFSPFNTGAASITVDQIDQHPQTKVVANMVFKVLKAYLDGDSRKNELYIAQHINFLYTLVGGYLDVEPLFAELFRDNQKIVSNIRESEIEKFARLLKSGDRDPDYLEILGVFCSCDSIPIRGNQNEVVRLLLDESREVFFLTDVRKGRVEISTDNGTNWTPLSVFCAVDARTGRLTEQFEFFQMQLELMTRLGAGRNSYSHDLILTRLGMVTWDECYICMQDVTLPASLRKAYVRVVMTFFIDCDSNFDILANINLTYDWKHTRSKHFAEAHSIPTLSVSGSELEKLPLISRWIKDTLDDNQVLIASQLDVNEFVTEVLKMLRMLVTFGYYTNQEENCEFVAQLTRLLDMKRDLPHPGAKKSNESFQKTSKALKAGADKPSEISDRSAKMPSSESDSAVENSWLQHGRFAMTLDNDVLVATKIAALDTLISIVDVAMALRLQMLVHTYKQVTLRKVDDGDILVPSLRNALREALEHDVIKRGNNVYQYSAVVQQYLAALRVGTDWIPASSGPVPQMGDDSLVGVVLDLARFNNFELLHKAFRVIDACYSSTEKLYQLADRSTLLVETSAREFNNELQKLMPKLRRIGRGVLDGSNSKNFIQGLYFLRKKCMVADPEIPGSSRMPHFVNQQVLFNSGILSVLIDLIDMDGQRPDVLRATFMLMAAMADRFAPAQTMMFTQLGTMLDCKGDGIGWENSKSLAVAKVFSGNETTARRVTGDQIATVISLVAEVQYEAPDLPEALCHLAKLDRSEIVYGRNQRGIIQALVHHRNICFKPVLIDVESSPENSRKRKLMLRGSRRRNTSHVGKQVENKEDARRVYHLGVMLLLSVCAEGTDRFIESICQSVMSFQDLVDVLVDRKIDLLAKTAYIRFLLWVYIRLDSIAMPPELVLRPPASNIELFGALLSACDQGLSKMEEADSPLSTKERAFLYTAFFPLMTDLCIKHYNPTKYPDTKPIFDQIAVHVTRFSSKISPSLQERQERKVMLTCSNAVKTKMDQALRPFDVDDDAFSPVMSKSEQMFKQKYYDQGAVNEKFSEFAKFILLAYQGPNTLMTQLPESKRRKNRGPSITDEMLMLPYCEPEGSDEYLPLGKDFSNFVLLFVEWVDGAQDSFQEEPVECLIRLWSAQLRNAATLSAGEQEELANFTVRSLQALRAVLHNQEKLGLPMRAFQDELADLGAVVSCVEMMAAKEEHVVQESLAVLAQALEGGNKVGQDAFMKHCLGTREERFFGSVRFLIRRGLEMILEHRTLNESSTSATGDEDEIEYGVENLLVPEPTQSTMNDVASASPNVAANKIVPLKSDHMSTNAKTNEEDLPTPTPTFGNVELLLRCIQMMCEGHNHVIQDYFREQLDNVTNVNVISEMAELLTAISSDTSDDILPITRQLVHTLVEVTGGDEPNQEVICDLSAIDNVNVILRGPTEDRDIANLASLHMGCALLIQSMVEDNTDGIVSTATDLASSVDFQAVFIMMSYYRALSAANPNLELRLDDGESIELDKVGFELYKAVVMISDHTKDRYEFMASVTQLDAGVEHAAFAQYRARSASIEILRDGRLQKIHFECKDRNRLTEEMRESMKWNVNRDSPMDKLRDFVDRARVMGDDIRYLQRVVNVSVLTRTLVAKPSIWKLISLTVTVLLNILMLTTWKGSDDEKDAEPDTDDTTWYPEAFTTLSILHMFTSLLLVSSFYLIHPPTMRATARSVPFVGGALEAMFPAPNDHRTEMSFFSILSVYHIVFLAASVLGYLFDGYFFGFHLLHIIVGNDILERVIQAVTKNGISLLWVSVLMLIIIYIFSLFAFAFMRENFNQKQGEWCDTAFNCFISSLRLGLLSGGGLGEAVQMGGDDGKPGFRTIFDVAFFLIITIIGLNVVFGIIVDTFSELRDEKFQIQAAMESECFIWSVPYP